jgi:hypothetical protein
MEHAEVTREETEAVKVQLLCLLDVSPMMSRILANRCVSVSVSVTFPDTWNPTLATTGHPRTTISIVTPVHYCPPLSSWPIPLPPLFQGQGPRRELRRCGTTGLINFEGELGLFFSMNVKVE